MVDEKRLYLPIIDALGAKIQKGLDAEKLGICYLENTSSKIFSNKLQRVFDDEALFFLKVEGVYPDITGYIAPPTLPQFFDYTDCKIIVVEVKDEEIKIKHIYQVKQQAEFLRADYAFLISSEEISPRIIRFMGKRPEILFFTSWNPKTRARTIKRILIAQFDEKNKSVRLDEKLYGEYLRVPWFEPFRFRSSRKLFRTR